MQIAPFSFEQSTMQSFAQCGRQAQLLIWNTLFTSSLSALQDPLSQDFRLSLTQLQILLSHILFFPHEINLFSYCWVDNLQCFMHLIIPLCILFSIKHAAQHLRLLSAHQNKKQRAHCQSSLIYVCYPGTKALHPYVLPCWASGSIYFFLICCRVNIFRC